MAQGKFNQLLEELKRRRVFRVATIYVIATWPIIQIADILSPALNLPATSMRFMLMLFIVGFPLAIALSWIFNLTPKGIKKVQRLDDESSENIDERLIGSKTELVIIAVLFMTAVGLFFLQDNYLNFDDSPNAKSAMISRVESIAVLPFVPFSSEKKDEYFADGLSEELLNVLSKINSLRVVSRTSSFAYKGVNQNIQEVGRELGVDVILEGSVRRNDVDNTIRVTAQLIDVRSGTHIWSETYDRKFTDVFKIQDEITAAVVSELRIALLGEERKQLLSHQTSNTDAMVAYSRGRTELAKRTAISVIAAEKYFSQAVKLDPNYVTAYASLSESYSLLILYAGKPKAVYTLKAQEAVEKALALDANSGLVWAAQGLIYMSEKENYSKALAALEKALALNPNYAMANMWYGNLQEDRQLRMKYHRKAFLLDPKSAVAGYNVANNLMEMGRDKEAMEVFSQIIEADPFYPGAYMLVAQINQYSGKIGQALIQYKKSYELGKNNKVAFKIAELYIDLADPVNARKWMKYVKNDQDMYVYSLQMFEVSVLLLEGKRDLAEEALTKLATRLNGSDFESPYSAYNAVKANYWIKDFPSSIVAFEKAEVFRKKNNIKPMQKSGMNGYIYASYAYQQMEQFEKSEQLIRLIKLEQDRIITSDERKTSELWFCKSLVQAIEGEQQMSLISLQRAIDEGWTSPLRMAEEPIFQILKEDNNFNAMLAGLETKLSLMRDQLAFEDSASKIF